MTVNIIGSLLAGQPSESSGRNRRRHERRNTTWSVSGLWQDKSRFKAITINVSKSGFLMHTARKFNMGDKAYVKIETYTHGIYRIVDAVIEVKHVAIANNVFNCGVQFIKISESHLRFLNAYVNGKNPHLTLVKPKELVDDDMLSGGDTTLV